MSFSVEGITVLLSFFSQYYLIVIVSIVLAGIATSTYLMRGGSVMVPFIAALLIAPVLIYGCKNYTDEERRQIDRDIVSYEPDAIDVGCEVPQLFEVTNVRPIPETLSSHVMMEANMCGGKFYVLSAIVSSESEIQPGDLVTVVDINYNRQLYGGNTYVKVIQDVNMSTPR